MSFWEKIKQSLRSFMYGRNGADQLSVTLLWTGLGCLLLSSILTSIQWLPVQLLGMLVHLASIAAYFFCVFRMFSKNLEKRRSEERRFVTWRERKRTEMRQAKIRFQNRKKYKYFKCPSCKAWLRLPHGKGVVTITCSRCHNSFTQRS